MSLVNYFFRKETFDIDYPLFNQTEGESTQQLTIPEYRTYNEFFDWTKQLPNVESPAWSGLPLNVEKINRIKQAEGLIINTKLIQGTEDEELGGDTQENQGGNAAWLVSVQKKIDSFCDILPQKLNTLNRGTGGALVKNPLFRFLERECGVLSALLQTVWKDFNMILEVCRGEKKSTNYVKLLAQNIHAEVIPNHWKKYVVPLSMTASEWLFDFKKRVE